MYKTIKELRQLQDQQNALIDKMIEEYNPLSKYEDVIIDAIEKIDFSQRKFIRFIVDLDGKELFVEFDKYDNKVVVLEVCVDDTPELSYGLRDFLTEEIGIAYNKFLSYE